jgi:hypothetical protein
MSIRRFRYSTIAEMDGLERLLYLTDRVYQAGSCVLCKDCGIGTATATNTSAVTNAIKICDLLLTRKHWIFELDPAQTALVSLLRLTRLEVVDILGSIKAGLLKSKEVGVVSGALAARS